MNSAADTLSQRERELTGIISAYNQVTVQLRNSHESLNHQVRKLRLELEDKNRELARSERLSALGEMATGVAHEIRNPLGSIQLYASLLDRDLEVLPQAQKLVRKISAGVQALDRIVGGVLDFAGRHEPNLEKISLKVIVSGALETASVDADRKQVALVMEASALDFMVVVDRVQLEQALLNLVLNAIDAVDARGRVEISAAASPGEVLRIEVRDDGPGVDAEVMDRIFNPFFTTKDSGTGLGLAIAHRIVESHSGRILVHNRSEGGACFTIELPAASSKASVDRLEGVA